MSDIQKVIEIIKTYNMGEAENGNVELCDALDVAISALQLVEQYREIGTLEECREAREKQIAKNPKEVRNPNFYCCPNCGCYKSKMLGTNYCTNCGQKIDWSEVNV